MSMERYRSPASLAERTFAKLERSWRHENRESTSEPRINDLLENAKLGDVYRLTHHTEPAVSAVAISTFATRLDGLIPLIQHEAEVTMYSVERRRLEA